MKVKRDKDSRRRKNRRGEDALNGEEEERER